jgi:Ca-activated chloride channel family protein
MAAEGASMSTISFARPYLLGGLVLVAVAYALWCVGSIRSARNGRAVSRDAGRRPRFLLAALLATSAALGVVAAAQPRWGTELSAIPRRSAEVVFVVDVSRSMDAQDIAPSRLQAAEKAISSTIQQLPGDRFALVIFAGSARLRFPLTSDRTAATQVVGSLETGTVLVDAGTNVSSGVDVAMGAFDNGDTGGRLIVFVSDGEDLATTDAAAAASQVSAAGIDLIVAGAGTSAGATIPVYDPAKKTTSPKLGSDGKPIVTKLDDPFLRALAAAAGGRYNGSDLSALPGAVEGRVASLRQGTTSDQPANVPVERFQWFAAAALALLLLASIGEQIPSLRPGRLFGLAGALMAAIMLTGCATQAHDLNQQGIEAYQQGDFTTAVNDFGAARDQQPDSVVLSLNLATALDKAGRFDEAVTAAQRLLTLPDPKTRAMAYASVGHHEFAAGNLPNALDAFRSALLENPDDSASRHDYEVVLDLLSPPGTDQGQGSQTTPGEQPTPGEGTPQGGQPGPDQTPAPSAPGAQQGNQGGSTGPGQTPSPDALSQQIAQLDSEVNGILQASGGNPDAAQALQILQLLAERNRIAAQRDALNGGAGNPNDY